MRRWNRSGSTKRVGLISPVHVTRSRSVLSRHVLGSLMVGAHPHYGVRNAAGATRPAQHILDHGFRVVYLSLPYPAMPLPTL